MTNDRKQFKVGVLSDIDEAKLPLHTLILALCDPSPLSNAKYLTTIGVSMARKQIVADDVSLNLIFWQISSEDQFANIRLNYLRGCHAILIFFDPTKEDRLERLGSYLAEINKIGGSGIICFSSLLDEKGLRAAVGELVWQTLKEDVYLFPVENKIDSLNQILQQIGRLLGERN